MRILTARNVFCLNSYYVNPCSLELIKTKKQNLFAKELHDIQNQPFFTSGDN